MRLIPSSVSHRKSNRRFADVREWVASMCFCPDFDSTGPSRLLASRYEMFFASGCRFFPITRWIVSWPKYSIASALIWSATLHPKPSQSSAQSKERWGKLGTTQHGWTSPTGRNQELTRTPGGAHLLWQVGLNKKCNKTEIRRSEKV